MKDENWIGVVAKVKFNVDCQIESQIKDKIGTRCFDRVWYSTRTPAFYQLRGGNPLDLHLWKISAEVRIKNA